MDLLQCGLLSDVFQIFLLPQTEALDYYLCKKKNNRYFSKQHFYHSVFCLFQKHSVSAQYKERFFGKRQNRELSVTSQRAESKDVFASKRRKSIDFGHFQVVHLQIHCCQRTLNDYVCIMWGNITQENKRQIL